MAQWIARKTSNLKVVGSSPTTDCETFMVLPFLKAGKDVDSNSIIHFII